MKRLLKQILIFFGIIVLAGAGVIVWHTWPRQQRFYTDADTIKTPQDIAVLREILWKPPTPLPDGLNTTADDYEPELSADGQAMFFVRGKAGQNADIYQCLRAGDTWGEPEPLTSVNTPYDELGPELSTDGRLLYFYSDRPGSLGGYDLWVSRLGEDGWRPATNLGPNANSSFNDYGPALSPDGATLYFSSNRPRPDDLDRPDPDAWPATLREQRHQNDYDLYASAMTEGGVGPALLLIAVCTEFNEGAPAVSPYGDFLYFASDRPDGFGGFDLYRSRRLRGAHEPATNLGASVNTTANELDPELSLGGYALHFSSDRGSRRNAAQNQPDTTEQRPDYNLYRTTSREVFREIETRQASINWAALWRQIGPNLLWALLALILILLLLALLRDFRQRKMSLLARCLLASLLVHLLLMLLFNVMEVTSGLVSVVRGRGKIQVALLSPAAGNEIADQIRGQLTQVDAPKPKDLAIELPDIAPAVEPIDATAILTVERASPAPNEEPTVSPVAQDAPQPIADTDQPREVGVRTEAVESLPVMDIALPPESEPVETAEADSPVPPKVAVHLATRAAAPVFATTQPAAPKLDYTIAPDRVEATNLDGAICLPAEARGPRDADPASTSREAPIQAPRHVAAVSVAMPEWSLPPVEVSPMVEHDESSPIVAATATESIRAGVRASLGAFVQSQPSVVATHVQPESTGHDLAGESTLVELDAAATEAWPGSPPAIPTTARHTEPVLASLDEVALPTVDGRIARVEPAEGPSLLVQAVVPDQVRAEAVLSANDGPEIRASELAVLPLASDPAIGEPPCGLADAADPPDDAPTNDLPMPVAEASHRLTAIVNPLPSEVDLPTELEPPGKNDVPGNAIGTIRGRVTDAESEVPLPGATVRLVLPEEETVVATTDEAGLYELAVPPVPEFFALSASLSGYVPATASIAAAALSRGALTVDFDLPRQTEYTVAIEDEPDVHHLGNDRFEGRINSQFQKPSEGKTFRATFEVSPEQLPPHHSRAEVWLLAKGVQCPHRIRINGKLLQARLDGSPRDGSFGEFAASFDPAWLVAGDNKIKISATPCRGDLDDFEFVNVQIRLLP